MATRLATFDLTSGTTETVWIDEGIVEAPNWLPDDSGLLVNKDGRLYRVPLAAPRTRSDATPPLANTTPWTASVLRVRTHLQTQMQMPTPTPPPATR